MKNTALLLLFLFSGLGLSAQLDLSTNLGDLGWPEGSIYLEKPVSKITSIEVGLISRVYRTSVSYVLNDQSEWQEFDNDGLITRLDYKIYFSKRRLEHQGWYFSLFNRNLFVYSWDENYRDRWIEENGSTSEQLEYLTSTLQSIMLGWTVGFKRVFKNNIIISTSLGYSAETLNRIPLFFSGDPVGSLGVGYRFASKKKAEKSI